MSLAVKSKTLSENGHVDANMIQPLHDRVVVERLEAEQTTAGGIIIPDTAKEKPQQGMIVSVGPGKKDYDMYCKPGDRVLFGKYAGQEINWHGKEYLIMREEDILAVLPKA